MLGISSIFLFNFFYMHFATRPRPALTAVMRDRSLLVPNVANVFGDCLWHLLVRCIWFPNTEARVFPPEKMSVIHNSVLREWVLDNRKVKSEEKMPFTPFEKCKWKNNDLRLRSRNESEIKMTGNRDREVKVKWKSFEIEIEKWNFSRIFENLKRTDFDLSERVHLEVISFLYVIC